jgi:hypothetical protein
MSEYVVRVAGAGVAAVVLRKWAHWRWDELNVLTDCKR